MKNSFVVSRRQVLRGAGGFTLGLPFLPSLVPRQASGAEPTMARTRRFVAITTEHGGVAVENMLPARSTLTTPATLFPGFVAASGRLQRTVEGTDAVLSPVLRAPAAVLSERLVGKLNVLHGLDVPFYIGHHAGGHLGNYHAHVGNPVGTEKPLPTIDQVMAWSPGFYRDLAGVRLRCLYAGPKTQLSWSWSSPATRSGTIQRVANTVSSLDLFKQVFVPAATAPGPAETPIVDRVIASYRSLRQSDRRMSAADRQRLDDHMDRLAELQRRLTPGARPASCAAVKTPTADARNAGPRGPLTSRQRFALINDVIAAAFLCGTSRIAIYGETDGTNFSDFAGDWHQDVAHQADVAARQAVLAEELRAAFNGMFLDLAAKLDVEEAPGTTVLDNTLLQWTQESGWKTHWSVGLTVVTAGSAGGTLRTGLFCDYTNRSAAARLKLFSTEGYSGLLYSRWLATACQAMGVTAGEFPATGNPGYGETFIAPDIARSHVPGVVASGNDPLPFITAG